MDTTCEKTVSSSSKSHVCEFCERSYSLKSSLNRHYRKLHKLHFYMIGGKTKCPFPSCGFSCKMRRHLRIHLNQPDTHNIAFSCYKRKFNSMAEFMEWKAAEEEKTNTLFTRSNKTRPRPDGSLPIYYWCYRSGYPKSKNLIERKKQRKTVKINATCPAAMNVKIRDGKVSLVYHKTHVGHGDEMQFQRLSKAEKDYIANKLFQGFSFDKILEDIKNDESFGGQKIKTVNKRDIRNIMKSYGVEWDKDQVFSDLKNTDEWVKQLKDFSFSPVLIYKPRGMMDRQNNLYKRDFMLSIMTEGQKQIVEMSPKSVVGIICSPESNSYRFFLVQIFVVDESGLPFPIAYCLTNRTDETGMKAFVNSVKKEVGKIDASLLISDNSQSCHKAWIEVMGQPIRHVLYFPVMKFHWRKNVHRTIGDKEKREMIFNLLVTLSKKPDCAQFELLLKSFVDKLERDDGFDEFGTYFKNNFLNKTDMWALCYYSNAGLPTIAHLEEMHERVRDTCFYEDIPKSVDLCIRELLLLTHERLYMQLSKMYGDTDYLAHAVIKSHENSEQSHSFDIECVEDSVKWRIKTSDDESLYTVQKKDVQCLEKRQLYCSVCQAFLDGYSCNCVDYLIRCTFCEHVHVVASLAEKSEVVTYNETDSAVVHLSEANYEVISCEEVVDFAPVLMEADELKSADETNVIVPILLDNCDTTVEGQCDNIKQNATQYICILSDQSC